MGCEVDKKRNRLKLFLIIVICTMVMILGYYDNIVQYNNMVNETIENELSYGGNLLKVIVDENLDKSELSNQNIIKLVKYNIDTVYKDDDILKADMINLTNGQDYDMKITSILSNSIKGYYLNNIINDNNDKFWMSKDYILSNLSYNSSQNSEDFITVENEIEKHYNKDLAIKFFENIRNQDINDIQFWGFLPNKYGIKYQEMDTDRILNIYKSYRGDLNSIDNIEFLKPTYMYQRVDIMGNQLVSEKGTRNDDICQLILVQGFNVVDIIENNPEYNVLFNNIVNNIDKYESERITKLSHLSIVISLIIIVIIGGFVILAMDYNNQLLKMEESLNKKDRRE